MKSLLIIQTSGNYFLWETLMTLVSLRDDLKNYNLSLLCQKEVFETIYDSGFDSLKDSVLTEAEARNQNFDVSVNLSLEEGSWKLHHEISSALKLGPEFGDGILTVRDLWSSYHLTLKGRTPFLTFHLRDLYRSILGFKKFLSAPETLKNYKQLIWGSFNPEFFPLQEIESFSQGLTKRFPGLVQKELDELGPSGSLEGALYIGPPDLRALKLTSRGAKAIILTTRFQGLNLIPFEHGHDILTLKETPVKSQPLLSAVSSLMKREPMPADLPFHHYHTSHDENFGVYLENPTGHERSYPVYQAQVVLWNFLLNMTDIEPSIRALDDNQKDLLKEQMEIVSKLLRLHDYALVSLRSIYQEAKSDQAQADVINGHLKNLQEMENTFNSIAEAHPLLRPIIDFYRIRKGQNDGRTLQEQTQNSLLTYSEEHQALEAYQELLKALSQKT